MNVHHYKTHVYIKSNRRYYAFTLLITRNKVKYLVKYVCVRPVAALWGEPLEPCPGGFGGIDENVSMTFLLSFYFAQKSN